MISNDARFTEAWSNHRGFLLDVAYRLLGSYSEAEDIVQEAFTKLLRTDLDPIEDVRAWLLVVLSRQCLDQLRSARVRREAYVGPWFPEPLIRADDMSDPADVVTLEVRTSNEPAIRLYEKYGFQRVGLRRGYYTDTHEDALIMTTDHIRNLEFQDRLQQLRLANRHRLEVAG